MVVETEREGRETALVLIRTLPLPGVYTKRKRRSGSITDWERIRPNASTILCGYLHLLFLLILISAYIAKHTVGLEEKAKG
jgi:hypothetical protein